MLNCGWSGTTICGFARIFELQREKNVASDMCAQRRLKSACASVQSDMSLRCQQEGTLHAYHFVELGQISSFPSTLECSVYVHIFSCFVLLSLPSHEFPFLHKMADTRKESQE